MSYQRIGTPRIYTCNVQYHLATGKIDTSDITSFGSLNYESGSSVIELFDMRPSNQQTITADGLSHDEQIRVATGITSDYAQDSNFVAILGHNFNTAGVEFRIDTDDSSWATPSNTTMTEVVNAGGGASGGGFCTPTYNGWSLVTFSQTTDNENIRIYLRESDATYNDDIKIGAIMIGEYIDLPHSPNLNIKKSLSFGGVTQQTSMGGQTYSNASYLTKASWGALNPWALSTSQTTNNWATTGRLHYDMSFSYLADSDVFPLKHYNVGEIAQGNDLFSNLMMRTNGGHTPFILQLDNSITTSDDNFIMCRLDGEPSFTQSAPNYWDVDLKIIEEF
jgi:hypothetical protein